MRQDFTLSNADFRLLSLVWEHGPISSPELCKIAEQALGWKRTTTYTVIKRLSDKGCLLNENTIVSTLVTREQVQQREGRQVLDRRFGGSLPQFVAAFLDSGTVSEAEAREIQRMLDEYRRKQ
jgi:predicted transcriptional regulator